MEPYNVEVTSGTNKILVVNASLTDEVKSHFARISYSFPIGHREGTAVSGASVWIEDDEGIQALMLETEPGYYQTDSCFAGVVGKSYFLHITTSDGREYISSKEKLNASPPIDSIYGEFRILPSRENETVRQGVQFFVDSRGDSDVPLNYRYEFEETHQLQVPLLSEYILVVGDSLPRKREPLTNTCYKTRWSKSLILGTTLGLSDNRISKLPVRFIDETDPQLVFRYSLIVKQYSISAEAHNYFKIVKENNESSGSLFDKQKGSTFGNIHSPDDPSIPVLGYFEVAGVSENRRVFSPEEFVPQGFDPPFIWTGCSDPILNNSISKATRVEVDSTTLEDGTVIYDTLSVVDFIDLSNWGARVDGIPLERGDTLECIVSVNFETFEVAHTIFFGECITFCTDCRHYGKLKKPDFWD